MKLNDIETLVAKLGGELPEGLKDVKEAYAIDLAKKTLAEMDITDVEGKSLDQLDEMLTAAFAAADLAAQSQASGNGDIQQDLTEQNNTNLFVTGNTATATFKIAETPSIKVELFHSAKYGMDGELVTRRAGRHHITKTELAIFEKSGFDFTQVKDE